MSAHYLTAILTQTFAKENIQWGFCHLIAFLHNPLLPINVRCCSEFPHVPLMLIISVSKFSAIMRKDTIAICIVSTWLRQEVEKMCLDRVKNMLNSKSCGVNLQDVSGSALAFSVTGFLKVCVRINSGTLVSLVFTVTSRFLCSSVNL